MRASRTKIDWAEKATSGALIPAAPDECHFLSPLCYTGPARKLLKLSKKVAPSRLPDNCALLSNTLAAICRFALSDTTIPLVFALKPDLLVTESWESFSTFIGRRSNQAVG